MKILSNVFNSRLGKALRLFVLIEAVAVIFSGSMITLPTSLIVADAHAQRVPEMPIMLVPVLFIMTISMVAYIRNRRLSATRS